MNSPFQFGKTVSGFAFTDRKEQLRTFTENLSSGISSILISPRRWGKSSLVKKCMDEVFKLNNEYLVVMIDLFRIRNEEEFLEIYATELIKSSTNKIEELIVNVKEFFTTLIPKISLSVDTINDISLSFDRQELTKNRAGILDLPQAIALKKKKKIIICIDEFQNILNYKNSDLILKDLRSSWQNQNDVTFCLYGSKRHMMSVIFNDSSSAFYRFGAVIFLNKIEKQYWIPFISEAFANTEKHIPDNFCGEIADLMGNHPYYVQQLSHIVWNLTENIVDSSIVSAALEQIIQMNSPFFIQQFEVLSSTQINLLKAVCYGETHLNSTSHLHKYRLGTSGNVSKNKRVLMEQDIIDIINSKIFFIDPVFEQWFRETILS